MHTHRHTACTYVFNVWAWHVPLLKSSLSRAILGHTAEQGEKGVNEFAILTEAHKDASYEIII